MHGRHRKRRRRWQGLALALMTMSAVIASAHGANSTEHEFLRDMARAMARMMTDMAASPSGNVDRDFAQQMIPHHQGAIDMARAELLYGTDQQLRRIAQGIIVEQAQEIEAMRLAVDQLPALVPSPPRPSRHQHGSP